MDPSDDQDAAIRTPDYLADEIVGLIGVITRLMLFGFLLALAVIAERAFRQAGGNVAVAQLTVPVTWAFTPFVLLTCAHYVYAASLLRSIREYRDRESEPEKRNGLFRRVSSQTGVFTLGLRPAQPDKGRRVYQRSFKDPSMGLEVSGAILLAGATIPWHLTPPGTLTLASGWPSWLAWAAAAVTVVLNWLLVSTWVARLSEIVTLPPACSSPRPYRS
ncbi:hypothetical protein [Micromonospora cathayae]|uniref:RDD family protein n=1 Tax=Micromonospora cathayae TaxID=3028804 RepID=A0ABY7ZJS3_9ACTN|nr:hypothetical protein [Micromonospora sp. HUAS 3]WDZ83240.1 hypothetical protein PVK37_22645 [Micromonospora sp. HUAS 3]